MTHKPKDAAEHSEYCYDFSLEYPEFRAWLMREFLKRAGGAPPHSEEESKPLNVAGQAAPPRRP